MKKMFLLFSVLVSVSTAVAKSVPPKVPGELECVSEDNSNSVEWSEKFGELILKHNGKMIEMQDALITGDAEYDQASGDWTTPLIYGDEETSNPVAYVIHSSSGISIETESWLDDGGSTYLCK